MKKEVFKYLKSCSSMEPLVIDKLLVSSYLVTNNIIVKNNELVKSYILYEKDKDEYNKLQTLVSIIRRFKRQLGLEDLIQLFEFVISPIDKVVSGAVYTPGYIREFIVNNSITEEIVIDDSFKIADISCGCGGFLFDAAKKIRKIFGLRYYEIFDKVLYGLDIKDYSISRTKLLLTLLAISEGEDVPIFRFNLFLGNALEFEWGNAIQEFNRFNIILGNPPYVCSRNIPESSKALLSNWDVCNSGHPDLYIPFFQIGLENLKDKGFLGYITMNTFFKSVNGRTLRDYFKRNRFKFQIIDFGSDQIFESKSTYTCICFIEREEADFIEFMESSHSSLFNNSQNFKRINYSELQSYKGWNLKNKEIANKIENTGIPFGQLYKTRNGVATLKNSIYIFKPINESPDYYFLQNGNVYEIEKGICKDIINPNKFTKNKSINELRNKAIFPYFYEGGKAKLFTEKEIKLKFPKAYKYLSDKKIILDTRDKGKGNYENWYAYGRNQSLEKLKYKLFFPHISSKIPNYTINCDEDLLFHNGLAIITDNEKELHFLKKLLSSRLFWHYIKTTSKPYGSGYYSLSRNYLKNFGVYNFSEREKAFIMECSDYEKINKLIEDRYGIKLV